MTFRRRDLLRLGGLGLALGIGGCVSNEPWGYATLSLSIRESFDASPPVRVPLAVSAEVQSVDTKVAALRGVDVVALDADGSVLATHTLGDLTWRDAPESQRTTEETEVGFGSTVTAYAAEWSPEPTLETSTVPTALTFAATGLSLGRDDTDGGSTDETALPSLVAPAAASQPPPPLDVRGKRLRERESLPATVEPGAYTDWRTEPDGRELDGEPLAPPTPPATDTARGTAPNGTRADRKSPSGRTGRPSTTDRAGPTPTATGESTATADRSSQVETAASAREE